MPPTPEKNITFHDAFHQRRAARMNSLGEGINRHGRRRKKSVRSVYLHDGETHTVWKPSAPSPVTPAAPPSHFADVVHEVMRQNGKLNLRERQRQLLSRVTATQQVLKEQNEELATVAELTEDEGEEDREGEQRSVSAPGQRDTPGRKMWQHLIKSVIDEKKESEKDRKRNRKRSTVHFHEVVTNKVASMEPPRAVTLPSTSEQGETATVNNPVTPRKTTRRKTSVISRGRLDTVTPSGAIPFMEWKSQFYERQRLGRQDSMKQFKSDYNLKAKAANRLPRINSDNHLTFPAHRRVSVASGEDLEPRSKSVSQYRQKLRRSSSPDVLDYSDYDDHGEISDTSVALDDMLSPLSSRSVSPSVFSDEEEQRRSKLHSRTPTTSRAHHPLIKLDSEEVRVLGNPSNMQKRLRSHHRHQYQDNTRRGDDIIEIEPPTTDQSGHLDHLTRPDSKRRPKHVSISLPTSPRGTPSPRPTTPQSHLAGTRVASSPTRGILRDSVLQTPTIPNDRITREQRHRESLPHLMELAEEEYQPQPHRRAVTPDSHQPQHRPVNHLRRSSTPTLLNSGPPPAPSSVYGSRGILTSSPPPPVSLLSGVNNEPPRGPGEGQYTRLHSPTGTSYMTQTTV